MPDRSLEDEIRGAYPDVRPPDEAERSRARAALQRAIEEPARRRFGGLPRSGVRWFLPVGAAVASAIVAAVLLIGAPGNGVEPSSAAEVLRNAAQAERELAPPLPDRGEYLYVRSENAYMTTILNALGPPAAPPGEEIPPARVDPADARASQVSYAYLEPEVREVWMGEESSVLETDTGEPKFFTDADRDAWIAGGRPYSKGVSGSVRLGDTPPLELPSDPDQLYEELRREAARYGGPDRIELYVFEQIGASLRERSSTPEQRAALFEVAARLDSIELVGEVEDPSGRPGIAVAFPDVDGVRKTLVFDPETWALLAEEDITVSNDNTWGFEPGVRVGYAIYLERAIVDEAGERP